MTSEEYEKNANGMLGRATTNTDLEIIHWAQVYATLALVKAVENVANILDCTSNQRPLIEAIDGLASATQRL